MKYNQIPNTNLNISVISLGTWVFGGNNWGNAGEKDCIRAVGAAIDSGINLIDTAPIYGDGRAENIVGRAIAGKRDKVFIATKCGLLKKGGKIVNNLKPCSIRQEIEQSLKRLKTDFIDIYQCHWPDARTPIHETLNELLKIRQEGKIRYIGVSNFDLKLLQQAAAIADIVSLQNNYSLLERSVEDEILPYCAGKGIGFIAYGPLGGGVLTGKYTKPSIFKGSDARSFFYKHYDEEGFRKASAMLNVLSGMSMKIQKQIAEIALNWVWQKEGVVSAITGCRNSEQVHANAPAGSWKLSMEDIKKLDCDKECV